MSFKSEIWMNYLKQFKEKTNGVFNIKKNQPLAAVIVEPRQDELLDLVINNFMYFLQKDWSLYIFHGTKNEEYVKEITKNMGDIYLINLKVENLTPEKYNQLLTSEEFYNHFHCEKILIFQTDTLLRKEIPKEFFEYDYVGAPWSKNISGIWGGMVGNGGLSLRKVSKMKQIIKYQKYNPVINEDGYFSYYAKILRFHIPTYDLASKFAIETVFHPDPVGLHKPEMENYFKSKEKEYKNLFFSIGT